YLPYGVYAWLLLFPALLLGYLQYKDAGIRREDHTIIASARLLSKWTAIMKQYRVQATQLKQNPFQARLNLQDIIYHVASGNRGRSFVVRDLDTEAVYSYWSAMYESSDDLDGQTAPLQPSALEEEDLSELQGSSEKENGAADDNEQF